MFVHETHLPQVLPAEAYTSNEQFAREMSCLFEPAWHCVGVTAELPGDGDYFTFNLLGRSLIVWRVDGEIRCFLNVCPHRFSMLTVEKCGHAGDRLACRYHGWEFDKEGNTRRIPDAQSFKPMEKGELGLHEYRAELCGQLIYVTLSAGAPSLREFMGPAFEICERYFGPDRRHFYSYDFEVDSNWKIKIENALESYHVTLVHPQTFSETPRAEDCTHELQPGWTIFRQYAPAPKRIDAVMNRIVHRLAGVEQDDVFEHYFYYPHVLFARVALFTSLESIYPLSPSRTRVVQRYVCRPGREGSLRARLLAKGLGHWGKKFFTQVAREDAGVLGGIQRGMESEVRPSEGLISIREERLFHFQRYIKEVTQDPPHMMPQPMPQPSVANPLARFSGEGSG